MVNYYIGDLRPDFRYNIRDKNGDALNLTGSTAVAKMRKIPDAGETVSGNQVERAATPNGLTTLPQYVLSPLIDDFEAGDDGNYKAWLKITLPDSDPMTTSKGPLTVKNEED